MDHLSFKEWLPGAGRWGRAAAAFDEENPEVYRKLVELAHSVLKAGFRQYGIVCLFEVLRYEKDVRFGPTGGRFSFNNNYRAFYARKIMDREPELEGFFVLRDLRSEREV